MGSSRRPARWADDVLQDLGFALRALSRNAALPLIAGLTLALGVGATTAVFSVARAILGNDLGLERGEGVVTLQEQRRGALSTMMGFVLLPYERVLQYREATGEVFEGVAGHIMADFSLRTPSEALPVFGSKTTANYFEVLGLVPAAGRFFTSDSEATVVLSHALWQRHFDGDRDAIGRTIYLDSRPYTVVGVAPEGFEGILIGLASGLWVPLRAHGVTAAEASWIAPFARLARGVTAERAEAVASAVAKRTRPGESQTTVEGATLAPLEGLPPSDRGMFAGFMGMLLGMAGLLLLIAAANIAGVLIARGISRTPELAVRAALGASRGRLLRQLLTESVLLFLLGGAGGLLVAYLITRGIEAIPLPSPFSFTMRLTPDLAVLAFGMGIAVVTGLLFGLAPALQAARADLFTTLREGSRGAARRSRVRALFVAAQVAMVVLLLVTTGLFVRTVQHGLSVDPGFDADDVVVATVDLGPHEYGEARARAFFARLTERIGALPGVEEAALSSVVFLSGNRHGNNVRPGERPDDPAVDAAHAVVDPAFFRTMKVPVIAGRALAPADGVGAPPAAVINEWLAKRLWPDGSAVGRQIRTGGRTYDVVGVVRDGRYVHIQEEPTAFVYRAFEQNFQPRMTLHVRTRATGETLAAIRREAQALDANVALIEPMPLRAIIGMSLLPQRFAAWFVGSFGVIGLLLAAVGVYGVLAAWVAQRYREIGIRLAIGAPARGVLRLVVQRAALLVLAGSAIGLAAALLLGRFLESLLFGVSVRDPVTLVAAPLVLVVTALLASYVPARRAVRVDPIEALRSE